MLRNARTTHILLSILVEHAYWLICAEPVGRACTNRGGCVTRITEDTIVGTFVHFCDSHATLWGQKRERVDTTTNEMRHNSVVLLQTGSSNSGACEYRRYTSIHTLKN